MSKKIFTAVILVIVVVIAAFVLAQNNLNTTAASNDVNMGSNGKDTSSNASEIIVTIQNGTFNPSNLTVKSGTTVTWVVKDGSNIKYMVTSNATGSVAGKYLFMSDHLTKGQNFSYTFEKTGTYDYYDMDNMNNQKLTGIVIVR